MNKDDQTKQIANWLNKLEIAEIINKYFRALDEKDFDVKHLEKIVTTDAKILRPNGTSLVGIEAISNSYQTSFARFEGTQHLLTGHAIDVDGEVATVRVNLVAMHLWNDSDNDANKPENFFAAGAIIKGELRRVEGQWKITFLDNTSVWRAGTGFKNMEQTDK